MEDKSSGPLITCSELAVLLGLRPATIRRWTSQRRIPHVRLNSRVVRYRLADVESIIRAGLRQAARPFPRGEDTEEDRR